MTSYKITSAHGHATICLQGAQVLEATLHGRPLLWVSPLAAIESGKSLRGGVPVCFPWFSKHPDGLPAHGFARTQAWRLLDQTTDALRFELTETPASLALWPHAFRAQLDIELNEKLCFKFAVENTGDAPFSFTYALHSYFAVTDSRDCQVLGLDGRLRREQGKVTTPQVGAVSVATPVDALFDRAPDNVTLVTGDDEILIDSENMKSAVVWNPGPPASTGGDIGDHWSRFVCVERGNIGASSITLGAGEQHVASMQLGRRA